MMRSASTIDPSAVSSKQSRRRSLLIWGAVATAVTVVGGGVAWGAGAATTPVASPVPAPATRAGVAVTTVRGIVRPLAWSRVGTMAGGVVALAPIDVGDEVFEGQELARIRAPLNAAVEVVAAPRSGTVTARAVSHGDTVPPGALLFVVADISSLRVEAVDVDEYTISRVHRGQRALVAVPALDIEGIDAVVRSVGPQPVGASVPDAVSAGATDHYPVSLELIGPVPGLRIGMAVRVALKE